MTKWIKTFDCDSYRCYKSEGKPDVEWFPTRGAGCYRVKISNDNFKRFYTLKEAKEFAGR